MLTRHDEAFELGEALLASLRNGWLEALRTDVGIGAELRPEPRKSLGVCVSSRM